MSDVFHPDRAVVMYLGILGNQFSGHQCNIMRRHMTFDVQAAAVDKGGIGHAQVFGSLIHVCHEFLLASVYMLSHGDAGVVSAGY